MAKSTETKEVAKSATAGLPAHLQHEMGELAGAGVSTDSKDFLLPFLAIAQSNSPQLKKQQADKYIPGLEAGDIFNTATGQFWKGEVGLEVIPCFYQKAEVEWKLRSEGGGYIDTHSPDSSVVSQARVDAKDKRLRLLPSGHQLVETKYHFVILPDGSPAVVGLTSSGLQVSRAWQTMMKNVKIGPEGTKVVAPSFAKSYLLRTVYRTNDQGDWFMYTITEGDWVQDADLFAAAKNFYLDAQKTGVVLGRPPETGAVVDGEVAGETDADEIPL